MTNGTGGPKRAGELYAMFLYRNAFTYLRMDKASALAWIYCIIIVLFTYLLFRALAVFSSTMPAANEN